MIRTVIVDDEKACRESLRRMLEDHCAGQVEVIGMADSVDTACRELAEKKPDLVLLDIYMPPGSGFEVLKRMGRYPFEVVFTTAYSEHAIKAIKVAAVDYLLKPIDHDELVGAISKVESRLAGQRSRKDANSKIPVPIGGRSVLISLNDIVRIEASLKRSYLVLKDNSKLLALRSLGEFVKTLQEYHFFHAHREHLINMNEIKEYIPGRNGGWVLMTDGKLIPIAARRKKAFDASFTL